MSRRIPTPGRDQRGFTIVEALVALSVLTVGLLALARVLTMGLQDVAMAPTDVIARQKLAEAIECVYTARDTRVLAWAQIRNKGNGGIFLDGPQPLRVAGRDGLVNTDDDGSVEQLVQPGQVNGATIPLNNFTREILIQDVSGVLRRLTVTVTISTGATVRRYSITTFISSYS
jgi:prepilin-type N-terminal cleavage/methylation domain-containing protein